MRACRIKPSKRLLSLALSTYLKVEKEVSDQRKMALREVPANKVLFLFFERMGIDEKVEMKHIIAYSKPFLEFTKLRYGAKDVVKKISKDYHLLLVSNLSSGWMGREVLKRNRILDCFTATLFSDEIGYRKPHPIIFKFAINLTGSNPEDCVMIGDELDDDMQGAKNLGIMTLWISMKLSSIKLPEYVDKVAISLTEISKILKRLIG